MYFASVSFHPIPNIHAPKLNKNRYLFIPFLCIEVENKLSDDIYTNYN